MKTQPKKKRVATALAAIAPIVYSTYIANATAYDVHTLPA